MISCEEAVNQLWDLLENDLEASERRRVDEHLSFCRRCCGELEFADELRRLMAARTAVEIPPDVQGRFEALLVDLDPKGPV